MKFFLNMIYPDTRVTDMGGHDFPDNAAARQEAILSAREIVADRLRRGDPVILGRFEITDEAGKVIETVTFKEALESPERFEKPRPNCRAPAPFGADNSC